MRFASLALCGLALGLAGAASAQSIDTLWVSDNGGSAGGMVYFDVAVAAQGLTITSFDINSSTVAPFGFQVWLHNTTYVGNSTSSTGWTMVATGSGTGLGTDQHTPITMDNTFNLAANTTYGMALSLTGATGTGALRYTNGTGSNQAFSNSDIALTLGAASNTQFGANFSPRVANTTIRYAPVPEPASMVALSIGALALLRRRRK
jgi:hypothetical protein